MNNTSVITFHRKFAAEYNCGLVFDVKVCLISAGNMIMARMESYMVINDPDNYIAPRRNYRVIQRLRLPAYTDVRYNTHHICAIKCLKESLGIDFDIRWKFIGAIDDCSSIIYVYDITQHSIIHSADILSIDYIPLIEIKKCIIDHSHRVGVNNVLISEPLLSIFGPVFDQVFGAYINIAT